MMKGKRVICAMSGGVDSSVAAAILKKQGYDVIGIFMKLWSPSAEATGDKSENICCSLEAATAARSVANKLNIPFYVVNFADEFKNSVVSDYIKEHEAGRTPNPCVICNRDIKGEILMKKVLDLEGDFLATGHYVRLRREIRNPNDEIRNYQYELLKSKDKTKDQTYFLWMLTQKHLEKMLFPIGDYTKTEVRKLAKKWGLPTAERKESQGICFIPDRDVHGFLHRYAKKLTKSGAILDINGKKLAVHNGLINYTVGQREGLGLGGPKAYYVVKLNSKNNTLIVGDEKDLYRNTLIATNLNWIDQNFVRLLNSCLFKAAKQSNKVTIQQRKIGARIRYRHEIESCQLDAISDKQIKITFKKPQRAITPGQSIVIYEGEKVLGGGVIE